MGANLPAAPKLLLQNDTSHSQKLTPNSTYGNFCGMNGMNGGLFLSNFFQTVQ
jgi:hypothetical protein